MAVSFVPFYDVISAQPIVDAGRLSHNRYKLAMSVGDNNCYRIEHISRRHFEQSAKTAGLPKGSVDQLCEKLAASIPIALEEMAQLVGNTVPAALVKSIARGVRARRDALFEDG